jgi:hypothetical protein
MQKIVVLVCALLLMACESNNVDVVALNQLDRDFFRKSRSEQVIQFANYSLEEQYKLLVLGNQIVHPSAMYLIPAFAKQGATAIPLLSQRLAHAKEEASIRDIVAILTEMHRMGLYDEAGNPDLKVLVDKRVTMMTGQWKATTEKMLSEIRGTGGAAR